MSLCWKLIFYPYASLMTFVKYPGSSPSLTFCRFIFELHQPLMNSPDQIKIYL